MQSTHKAVKMTAASICFKAAPAKGGDWRPLTNLYGPVEFLYQKEKFRHSSVVHQFLDEMCATTFEPGDDTFVQLFKGFHPSGNVESYYHTSQGYGKVVLSGILAKLASAIARRDTPSQRTTATKRLNVILKHYDLPPLKAKQYDVWADANVLPTESLRYAARRLWDAQLKKFNSDGAVCALLLATGGARLYEAGSRGKAGPWEYIPANDANGKPAQGGNIAGLGLERVRAHLRGEPTPPEPNWELLEAQYGHATGLSNSRLE